MTNNAGVYQPVRTNVTTPEICMEAVKQNGHTLQYVKIKHMKIPCSADTIVSSTIYKKNQMHVHVLY
jgi:hypothetical protein